MKRTVILVSSFVCAVALHWLLLFMHTVQSSIRVNVESGVASPPSVPVMLLTKAASSNASPTGNKEKSRAIPDGPAKLVPSRQDIENFAAASVAARQGNQNQDQHVVMDPSPDSKYMRGATSEPVDLVLSPAPEYPAQALLWQLEGTVKVLLSIGPDGLVTELRIVESSGFESLDSSAENALKQWKFSTHDATPGIVKVMQEVHFLLDNRQPISLELLESESRVRRVVLEPGLGREYTAIPRRIHSIIDDIQKSQVLP